MFSIKSFFDVKMNQVDFISNTSDSRRRGIPAFEGWQLSFLRLRLRTKRFLEFCDLGRPVSRQGSFSPGPLKEAWLENSQTYELNEVIATTVLIAEIEESIPVDVSEGLVDYLKVGFSEVNGSEGLTLEWRYMWFNWCLHII